MNTLPLRKPLGVFPFKVHQTHIFTCYARAPARLSEGNVTFVLGKPTESCTETHLRSAPGHPQRGWGAAKPFRSSSAQIINIWICAGDFPLAKFFRRFCGSRWHHQETAFQELQVVLFSFCFLFFFPQDKAENAITNRDLITGFS